MTRRSLACSVVVGLLVLSQVGCDDDDPAVSHSGDIGISNKLVQANVSGGVLTGEKNVTTETANPCAAFVRDAEVALGRSPSSIRVDAVTLELDAKSTGATTLDELWEGEVTVTLILDSGPEIVVARGMLDQSTSMFVPLVDSSAEMQANNDELLTCGYSVRVSGTVHPDLPNNFSADITTTLNLAALP